MCCIDLLFYKPTCNMESKRRIRLKNLVKCDSKISFRNRKMITVRKLSMVKMFDDTFVFDYYLVMMMVLDEASKLSNFNYN